MPADPIAATSKTHMIAICFECPDGRVMMDVCAFARLFTAGFSRLPFSALPYPISSVDPNTIESLYTNAAQAKSDVSAHPTTSRPLLPREWLA